MKIQTFYRCAVWLPLLIPAAIVSVMHFADVRPSSYAGTKLAQLFVVSGVYGGVPYALLAAYATWWIDERPERELRRKALAAPLWMILLWLVVSALVGILYGQVATFVGFFSLGAAVTLTLGYAYVGLVFLLRRLVCRQRSRTNRHETVQGQL
jgi:uncharacterized membrane-anchored protein